MRLAVLLALLALPVAPAAATPAFDPLAMYGPELRFRVWRDGSEIGSHVVTFRRDGEAIRADARFDVAVRLLGITVFRYGYAASALWRDGEMARIEATVDDDGTVLALQAERHGDSVIVDGPKGLARFAAPLWPTSHWHPGVLSQSRVLNTLTGGIDAVTITPAGVEVVATNAGPVRAARYRYSGDLRDVEAWYDDAGRWVGLRFPGTDGTLIEYVCDLCVRPPEAR